jgi:hypothetical protein
VAEIEDLIKGKNLSFVPENETTGHQQVMIQKYDNS